MSLSHFFGFLIPDHINRVNFIILTNFMAMLCIQQIYSVVCVIMQKTKYLAASMAVIVFFMHSPYSNFLQRVTDVDWINFISQFVFSKYNFNGIIMSVYGLGRCDQGRTNVAYHETGINEDHELNGNFIGFACIFFTLIVVECILINIRLKNYQIFNKLNIWKNKQDALFDDSISIAIQQNNICDDDFGRTKEMMIAWTDLSISIPITTSFYSLKSKTFTIFNGINGSFAVQSLNALMGPSGAGKTTLLKCLNAKYNKYLSKESKIFVKFSDISRNVFIKQDISEHLLSGLTVRQTLLYACKLKNSRIDKNLDHNSIISQLLSDLLISDTIDNRVESCSGGEQKRIAISCELTAQTKPKILCIDEPTSGLDSMAANVVCIGIILIKYRYPLRSILL